MNEKEKTKISKFLSLILRHKPEAADIKLDENGWVDKYELIRQVSNHGHHLTIPILEEIVRTNEKKRFEFDKLNIKIRASQGHSVDVDLQLVQTTPPDILFHGTAQKFLGSILKSGLVKGQRHHVHLSSNQQTASQVGSRHGELVMLEADTYQMHKDGFKFYKSNNGVWLTDNVPAQYLTQIYE